MAVGRVLALGAVFLAFPTVAAAHHGRVGHGAPNHRITRSTSSNWAGYAATGGPFTDVSARWKQPTASCARQDTYSAFWVGLDGDGSNTVEQIGTSADCRNGRPAYYAWFEMYPKSPVYLSLTVRPGDTLRGHVQANTRGSFTLTLRNVTTGVSFSTRQQSTSARLASAEAIAEAPSASGSVLPLTDFGKVPFSGTTVDGRAIGNFHPDRINMVSGTTVKATTSALSGGTSFTVTWKHS